MSMRVDAGTGWMLLFAAWVVALASTLGALFIGEVLGQVPCNLCWYQRIAMFPLALILGLACLMDDVGVRRYALPLAVGGLAIAVWHAMVYFSLTPDALEPCGAGPSCSSPDMTILGWAPLPVLSAMAFLAISLLLIAAGRKERT